jgi:tRNA A37 methylthiotransferase MiaB
MSVQQHRCALDLLTEIKKQNIPGIVVAGGPGVAEPVLATTKKVWALKPTEHMLKFGQLIKKRKLVDHIVVGDGEDAILQVLENNSAPTEKVFSEQFKSPIPDYSDYNFNDYLFEDGIYIPVTGSKGCVRDCDFCTIGNHYGKYRYRTGSDIANEMIDLSTKHGIRKFQFTDSLVNGGLKPFKDFLQTLANYNNQNPDNKISWSGQYIARLPKQMPDEYYPLIAQSGGHGLTIGADHGSDRVLEYMGKKTNVAGLYYELEMFRQNDITCTLLFMGHWSERWEDFLLQCQTLINLAPYARSGTISAIQIGIPMIFIDGSPSVANLDKNNIVVSDFDPQNIYYFRNDPESTFREKSYRTMILHRIAKELKLPWIRGVENLTWISQIISDRTDQINQFYEQF